jgi:hypothetical protein
VFRIVPAFALYCPGPGLQRFGFSVKR